MSGQNIDGLKERIAKLISLYEGLREREADLSERLERSEKLNIEKDNTINELKERLDNLQLTLALGSSSPDRAEARRKVAGLIKEIDKCIALLNN
ncbi:MAG: hypothetical protein IKX03_03670 [Bacteroidales bacterium]|nr:hypothetical protein [Bacteroidales bacterium]MBR5056277.1 hypothetical protein [Bacteroidales bacterium]